MDSSIAKLEARVKKLEEQQGKQQRTIAKLHVYLKRAYEAVKSGLSLDRTADYAVDTKASNPVKFLGGPTRLSGSAATGDDSK